MAFGNLNTDDGKEGANAQAGAGGSRQTVTSPSQQTTSAAASRPNSPYVPGLTVSQAPLGVPHAMATPTPLPSYNTPVGKRVGEFQNYAREGVQAYGNMMGRDFESAVGRMLGGINEIGGLRSGSVTAGTRDMMDTFGRSVGEYASMATRDAIGMGQREHDLQSERDYRAAADARARKSSRWGALGKIAGLGLSIAFPAKTAAAKVGQGILKSF